MPALYINLMPKDQDLGYQRSSRPEQPDQRRPNKAARFPHRTEALRDSASVVSPIGFTTGTRNTHRRKGGDGGSHLAGRTPRPANLYQRPRWKVAYRRPSNSRRSRGPDFRSAIIRLQLSQRP